MGGVDLVGHAVFDGGEQAGFAAGVGEELVEEGGGGGLAVGAGDAHERQTARGVAVPFRGQQAKGVGGVRHFYPGDAGGEGLRQALAHDGDGALLQGRIDEVVAVGNRTGNGDKEAAGADLA